MNDTTLPTSTTAAPRAPRRRKRRRNGLGVYQDTAGRWRLDIIIAGQRRHRGYGRCSFDEAKARAKADAAAFRAELLTGVSATPVVVDLTVGAALTRFEAERFSTLRPRTQVVYRKLMQPLRAQLGALRLSALSPLDLERYKRDRTLPVPSRRGTGQTSCNRELELLRTVVNACRAWGLTRADNPPTHVRRFKEAKGRDRVLRYDEEARLLAALPEPHRTLTQLGLEAGLRVQSEGIPLQWADVDLDRGQLHVKAADAKSGRERWLPLSQDMVARLRALQATSTSPYLFAAQRGGPLTHYKHRYWKAVRAAGLAGTGVDIHCLRHTFATRFYEATGDLLLLQKLGGWSSLTLVQRYAHARMERAGEAIRAMVMARESHTSPAKAASVTPLKA